VSASCRRALFPPIRSQFEKGHGRLEERAILCQEVAPAEIDFPFAAQIARIDRCREFKDGRFTQETVFVITSLEPAAASPERIAKLARDHWAIENQLHYRRDWSFDEDRCRIRNVRGARVMASLRSLAIAWNAAQPERPCRQSTLPQLQRATAAKLHRAVRAVTKPWL
jgi:predicted transposase YbfD/YdcC